MLSKFKLLVLLSVFSFAGMSFFYSADQPLNDRELVKAAVLDYVEGVYEVDPARIEKSVHPTLAKRGTWWDEKKGEYTSFQEMNFQQLLNLTKNWNMDGKRANSGSPKEVTIFDVQDKTASAKVVAAWGTDYFHLAKMDGKWYIMNVLWQTPKRS